MTDRSIEHETSRQLCASSAKSAMPSAAAAAAADRGCTKQRPKTGRLCPPTPVPLVSRLNGALAARTHESEAALRGGCADGLAVQRR